MEIVDITHSFDMHREWDDCVQSAPAGSVYHLSRWVTLYNSLKIPSQTMKILCCRRLSDGHIMGGCLLLEKERYGFRLAVNALATQYAGFILAPHGGNKLSDEVSRNNRILSLLMEHLRENYHQVYLYSGVGLNDLRVFRNAGWQVAPAYTYFVNLEDMSDLWDQLDGSLRRQIKKGERQGLQITKTLKATEFNQILDDTFARHNQNNPISHMLVSSLIEDDTWKANRFLLGAVDGSERLQSGIIALYDTKRAYYSFAATHSDVMGTGVHSWLIWELFKVLNAKGIHTFDFLGANIQSIARFKEHFNPEIKLYYSTTYWGSSLLRALKWFRARFNR